MADTDTRLRAIKKHIDDHGLTHILITDAVLAEYVSGFRASQAVLLLSRKRQTLFTDFRYAEAARRFCRKNPAWRFDQIPGAGYTFLARRVTAKDRVGIQSDTVTIDQYRRLRAALRGTRFVKLGDALARSVSVKTGREIRAMSRAARIGDRALELFLPKLAPGMTEADAAYMLEDICRTLGSEKPRFDAIVLFGPRTALPHGEPSDYRLRRGHWILCDFGCCVNGFTSDMTRTAVMGAASAAQKRQYAVVLQALVEAKKAIRCGVPAGEVDTRARAVIEKAGFGAAFGHATGHGLGLRVHEPPRVYHTETTPLQQGMIVTVEPGVYLPGKGGVRIEDMVLVTENGSRTLTHAPRVLRELTA